MGGGHDIQSKWTERGGGHDDGKGVQLRFRGSYEIGQRILNF